MNDKIHLNLSYHLGNSRDFRSSVLEKEMKIKYILLQIVMCLVAQSCPILCDPMDCSPPGSSVHGDSLGKNIGMGCHAVLQGNFPTQGWNPGLPNCRRILYHLSHQGSPRILEWWPIPSPGDLPDPGIELGSPEFQAESLPAELLGKPL